ncbi:MAG: hypothetical protein C0473_02405 [Cyanobacteria bacterium DS3.002]|nr:hypothetical protein [Cyanobacteria bacterium DS3.002]
MKRILTLFAGLILFAQTAQAKEPSIYSIFSGEIGKNGVLKQLAAISKAADSPSSVKPGQLTEQELLLRRSPYKNKVESEINLTEVRCQFAYDLHRFVASKNRDYDSIAYLNSVSNSAHGAKKSRSAYLPYLEQEGFANGWWTKKSKRYRESGASEKKLFLHEAIVDATNLYGWYGQRVYGTAAYVAWEEAAVQAVLKKQ